MCGKGVYAIFSDVPYYMQQLITFKHRTEQLGGCFSKSDILQLVDETGSIVCVDKKAWRYLHGLRAEHGQDLKLGSTLLASTFAKCCKRPLETQQT